MKVTLTDAQIRAGLLSGFSLSNGQFTFSIANASSTWGDYDAGKEPAAAGYSILTAAQAAAYRLAIAAWDILIAPNFAEVTETASARGELRIAFTTMDAGTAAYAYQGSNQVPTSVVGDIWFSANEAGKSFALGTYNYYTLLHEIGHALGLKHSFEAPVIPAAFENQRYTALSYSAPDPAFSRGFAAQGNGITTTSERVIVTTPMVLDIAAIQAQYGADPTTATGNSTYGFVQGSTQVSAIYDAGGTDTIDLSTFTRSNVVDLTPGAYSSIGKWTIAEQTAYWQAQFPGYGNFIPNQLAGAYEWIDNLGIALNTVIENVIGGSGNDTITGNAVRNQVFLQRGGDDSVTAGDGDDGIYFGAAFTAADSVNGGAGDDQIALQGNYAMTLSAGSVVGVETIVLVSGANTTFGDTANNRYNYALTLVDANIDVAQPLTISANALLATETLTVNASAVTGGTLRVFAGLGTTTLTGGGGSDGFFFGENGRFDAGDVLKGGAGADDQLGLRGDYSTQIAFTATTIAGIETIVLLSASDARYGVPGGTFRYDLKTHDANVASGETLTVTGVGLTANEVMTFDGSLESNGRFVLRAGAANDVLTGGAGADQIYGGLGSDTLRGGGGNDIFIYRSGAESTVAAPDVIADFANGDILDLSRIDANGNAADGDSAFAFIGTAAFAGTGAASAGQLRSEFVSGTTWRVLGDIDGDGAADFAIQVVGAQPLVGSFML